MTSFYEAGTSGMNIDRFVEDFNDDSVLSTFQKHYWTAKQLLYTKLGRKEDEHLAAEDMTFDIKNTFFKSIKESGRELHVGMEELRRNYWEFGENQKFINYLLKGNMKFECERLQNVFEKFMTSFEVQITFNKKIHNVFVRIYDDVKCFNERAVADCGLTIEEADKTRVMYRGSLLWMKNISEELNPDENNQMNKFRSAQQIVKRGKVKLDKLKEDTTHKVELLEVSRNYLLTDMIRTYKCGLSAFYENASKECGKLLEQLNGIEGYEIDILKILNDPVGKVLEEQANLKKSTKNYIDKEDLRQAKAKELEEAKEAADNFDDFLGDTEEEDMVRLESPLGIIDEEQLKLKEERDEEDEFKTIPLNYLKPIEKLIDFSEEHISIPSIPPPPKYEPNWMDKVKCKAENLMDSLPTTSSIFGESSNSLKYCPSNLLDNPLPTLNSVSQNNKEVTNKKEEKWEEILRQFGSTNAGMPNQMPILDISEKEEDLINLL
uniref:AH domain-containing protein n=1 Tax=Rhabditophanes sp. KR3021 TaxID=114890 RepID=A0AC35TJ50_9BILA